MPYPDLSFSEVTSALVRQNLRPEIPRCCPSALANVMKRCWDANPDKRPEMDEVVSFSEAIDTSKGGGIIPPISLRVVSVLADVEDLKRVALKIKAEICLRYEHQVLKSTMYSTQSKERDLRADGIQTVEAIGQEETCGICFSFG